MKNLKAAVFLGALSWLIVFLGVWGGQWLIPPGEGLSDEFRSRPNLFRFDSAYYFSIATSGYSYNGEPYSSPNIVFAPLFPLLIKSIAWIGLDEVIVGFVINKLLLIGALFLLIPYLEKYYSRRRSLILLGAMTTSAGAYSLHAFYSEPTLFFLMALILWSESKKNVWLMAAASGLAGAARLAALPFSLVTATQILLKSKSKSVAAAQAALAISGAAAFLLFIHFNFGNPFSLFPEIQSSSWGFFHPKVSPFFLLGPNLVQFSWNALLRGVNTFLSIQTLNLGWTILALASVGYSFRKWGFKWPATFFAAYVAFTYWTGAGSEFLISAHRFYVLLLPIFMMFADFDARLRRRYSDRAANGVTGLLLVTNLFYCLFHTASFNQGIWFFF